MEQLLDELIERVAATVSERVRDAVKATEAEGVRELPLCYTEEEAAEILKCGAQTLARRRKKKEIDHTVGPSGRVVYMPHHILNYLLENEIRAGGNRPFKAADVLRFPKAA